MTRRATAVLLCAVAAGGLQAAASDPATAQGSTCDRSRPAVTYRPRGPAVRPTGGTRLVPCVYDTGASAMEPTFAFTKRGAILFQAWTTRQDKPGGVPPVSGVLRSRDGGRHWTDVTPRVGPAQSHAQSFDPYLIVDRRTGRAFTVDYAGEGSPLCGTISQSDDEGGSWSSSPLACGGFDGESIAAGPPVSSSPVGYPDLVYYCTGTTLGSSPPATSPACSKSLDGGTTFSPTGEPPFPPADEEAQEDVYGPWAGNPVVAGDGTLYVPKRFARQPRLAISDDEGLGWTDVIVARNGSASQANHADVDSRGNVYYTWIADDHLPYVAVSRNRGSSFGPPIRLSPRGVREASIPKIEVDRPGRAAVTYLASVNARGRPPWYAPCNVHLSECDDGPHAGDRWNGYITLVEGLLDQRPLLQTATVKRERSPLFTGGCAAEGQCKAELDYVDVHFDRSGVAWGSFVDDCALERKFVPAFNAGAPRCADGVGKGILGQLRPLEPPGTLGGRFVISRRAVKLRRSGVARVRVSCRTPLRCEGRLRLRTARRVRVVGGRRRVWLGSRRFSIGSRHRNTVIRVRLSRTDRRLVRRLRKLAVQAVARVQIGAELRGTATARFRLHRPR